ncbi:MAG: adenine deaminase C-terminal domain-containing protein [Oscillospiraceae bacterium]|jgi:adenine deaminase
MRFDTVLTDCWFYNTPFNRFYHGWIGITGDKIGAACRGELPDDIQYGQCVSLGGRQVVPGLVDIHTHIESTLMTPGGFADAMIMHGVTTVVSEPHEIANVSGVKGVLAMIEAGKDAPMDIFYGIPSSVPASNSGLETTGGSIDEAEVAELCRNPMVRCLGEVMNARSVISEPDGKANRIVREFKKDAPLLPVEGHCPRLKGLDLAKFVFAGIDSDHTEHDLEEFRERWFDGMLVELQEKTLTPEIIRFMRENGLSIRTAIVTDDQMADTLASDGALDRLVRLAIKCGFPRNDAIRSATWVPAERMLLRDRGEIKPGLLADLVVLEEDEAFRPSAVYKRGRLMWNSGMTGDPGKTYSFPKEFMDTVKLGRLTEDDFTIRCSGTRRTVRTMSVSPERTSTEAGEAEMDVKDGELMWEGSGWNLAAVFDRYTGSGARGYGFLGGSCHKRGAVASTYSHDNHNLLVAGADKRDMAAAANRVRELGGGIAVAEDGKVIAEIALPVGGIMSRHGAAAVGRDLGAVVDAMRSLGYVHPSPIMSLCVISLTVSPELKVTDKGLVDVRKQRIVPLFADEG